MTNAPLYHIEKIENENFKEEIEIGQVSSRNMKSSM